MEPNSASGAAANVAAHSTSGLCSRRRLRGVLLRQCARALLSSPRTHIGMVRRILGPSGAYWLRKRVVDRVPILLGHSVHAAEGRGSRAHLQVVGPAGVRRTLSADHVIAATGYRFSVGGLRFLSPR